MQLRSTDGSQDRSLRSLVQTLLLSPTPDLTRAQLSDNILMWNRLNGNGDLPPHAYDDTDDFLDFFGCSTAEASQVKCRSDSQEAWWDWVAREPKDLPINPEIEIDLDEVNALLFFKHYRRRALEKAKRGDSDPLDMDKLELLCCEDWHQQGKFLVKFPKIEAWAEEDIEEWEHLGEGYEAPPRLMMTVIKEKDGSFKLDNMTAAYAEWKWRQDHYHTWTEACAAVEVSDGEDDESSGPEYIADPNEFWAGYSDEEGDEDEEISDREPSTPPLPQQTESARRASTRTQPRRAAITSPMRVEPVVLPTTAAVAEEEGPIRDIVRAAYTLHRSARPVASNADSVEAFLDLVRSTIDST